MWPEIFTVFGLPLRSFGFFVAVGFLVGVQFAGRLSRKYGSDPEKDADRIPDLSWTILLGVMIGARIAYVLINLDYFSADPLAIFKIWEGGLVMYGGLILAIILGLRKTRKLAMHPMQTADYVLTSAFLGQGFARFGCLAVGDDYGRTATLNADGSAPWWSVTFPDPLRHGAAFPIQLSEVPLHPTQLYMSLKAFLLFAFGMWLLRRKKFHGQVACALMAGYAVLRALVEFFRGDAQARGGIFKEGLGPEEVNTHLFDLGVANANGRIIDVEAYRQLLREGAEGVQAELLISTSQMVAVVTFVIAVLMYRRLKNMASHQLTSA